MKKIMLVLFISLLLTTSFVRPAEAALFALQPTDDTYVQRSAGNSNFNGNALISSYSNLPTCIITRSFYLRFDISSYTENVGPNTSIKVFIVTAPTSAGENVSLYSAGDDWNGAVAGNGSETSLTWNNQPGAGVKLDTRTATPVNTSVTFTSASLVSYVNSQRIANGGDDIVSFRITWDTCTNLTNDVVFEDRENTQASGFLPVLDPLNPTAVTVSGFDASPVNRDILVQWQTLTETDLLGFNIYRSSQPAGVQEKLNNTFIPAKELGNPLGASYEFPDTTALAGQTYYYWLEMVYTTGNQMLDTHAQATANHIAYIPFIKGSNATSAANTASLLKQHNGR